jgi:hypothetical protein
MSNPTSIPIDVDWVTAFGTADATDLTLTNNTVTFPALGSLTQPVNISVNTDTDPESNETFFVNLSNASAGSITDAQGTGTILNDDAAATEINIGDASALEGTDATMTFTVTRSGDTSGASTVDYAVTPGTAGTPGDYTANTPVTLSGTLSFAATETSQTVVLNVINDNVFELTEGFTVALSNATNALIVDTTGNGTITDDDAPTISITDVSQAEGTGGASTFTFEVTLSNPSSQTITVGFTTADGTATVADADYTTLSGTVTFNPLDVSEDISVSVGTDATQEGDEDFFVNLSNPSAGSIADNQGLGTIQNDDAASSLAIDDPSTVTEGTDPSIVFTVTRSGNLAPVASVQYTVNPGTAGTPGDYTGTLSGTLNFASSDDTETVTLTIVDDNVFELTENFTVTLSNAINVTISDGSGAGTIDDDDSQPTISIADVSQPEGDAANSMTFTVTLSNPSSQQVTVDFDTFDGSATVADNDYTAASGTVTFVAGDVSEPVVVQIPGDNTDEPDQSFTVDLSIPSNATIANASATGTLENDDAVIPNFTVNNVTLAEGNAGTTAFNFTVTLTPPSASATTVDVATSNGSATLADNDYAANAQTLNFPANTPSQTFTVNVNGDTKLEGNESFTVSLTNPTGGATVSGSGTGLINNDDPVPSISISDVSQFELDGGTSNFVFDVTLSNASSSPISVSFATANGTATLANSDYLANAGSVSFAPGEVAKTVTVVVNGDGTVEPTETFTVNLSSPVGATIADGSGTGTILDDDGDPAFVVDDPIATEGSDPTIVFTVTRTGNTTPAVSVEYNVAAGSATTPGDYTAFDPFTATLNFATGVTSQTVMLNVVDDAVYEPAETLAITLLNPSVDTTIADPSGTGTIVDDLLQPTISISDVTQAEGDAGTTAFIFTVTLSNPSSQTVTVDFATANGTATAGSDYVANGGTVTFPPGSVSQAITVQVNGDTTPEANETFFVNLTNPANATIADAQGLGTITNNDASGVAIPALGARELAMLALLLAGVAMLALKRA